MKLVAYTDVHAHLFTDFSEPDLVFGNTRMKEICKAVLYIHDWCHKHDVGTILFAGDLFHVRKAVDTEVWNLMYNIIKTSRLDYVMIPGNHDQRDNTDKPQHSLHGFRDLPNVKLLDDPPAPYAIQEGNEMTLVFPVPYSKNVEMVKGWINEYAKPEPILPESTATRILLGHLGVAGAFVGKSNYAMADAFNVEDLRPDAFDFGLFGHFHKWQFLGGHEHFLYLGAPIQHNFNDEGQEKGFWVIDTEKKLLSFQPIPTPKFITVTDPEAVRKEDLESNYVRFQVPEKDVEKLKNIVPPDLKYRVEPQKTYEDEKRADIDFSMSFTQILDEYVKMKGRPDALVTGLDILREVESS